MITSSFASIIQPAHGNWPGKIYSEVQYILNNPTNTIVMV